MLEHANVQILGEFQWLGFLSLIGSFGILWSQILFARQERHHRLPILRKLLNLLGHSHHPAATAALPLLQLIIYRQQLIGL